MKLTTSESPREFLFTYKRRFIFGFSSKYRVKNKHEFVDSSHQNKQNFEGKKLSGLSGKEFIAFEECVWQIRHSRLGELHAQILLVRFQTLLYFPPTPLR